MARSAMSCTELSLRAQVPLAGTARRADRWLVLEHRPPWGRDGVEDSDLDPRLVEALAAFDGRVLLARRPSRPQGSPVAFVANVTEHGGTLRRLELERPESLLDADLDRDGEPIAGPLLLVCTHARRDVCCGTHGVPTYNALRRHLPDGLLWRSSHQGGHRFATNVLALPHGIQLGRVDPESAAEVALALTEERIPLPFYRGRSLHSHEVQAADAAVRTTLGADRVGDIRFVDHTNGVVRLDTPRGVVEVSVSERQGPVLPASCGKTPEPTPILEAVVHGVAPPGT